MLTAIPSPVRMPVSHPLCDEVSFFEEPSAPGFFEMAVFADDAWYIDALIELSNWAEEPALDTMVYRFIPYDVLMPWLKAYAFIRQ